jgi:hypothetical protein
MRAHAIELFEMLALRVTNGEPFLLLFLQPKSHVAPFAQTDLCIFSMAQYSQRPVKPRILSLKNLAVYT